MLVCLCSKSEYAAFDPLFWLLHASVDRCIWLFQNNNYDGAGWKEPGKAAGARGHDLFDCSQHVTCEKSGKLCLTTRHMWGMSQLLASHV